MLAKTTLSLMLSIVLLLHAARPAWSLDAGPELARLMRAQYGAYSPRAEGWTAKLDGQSYLLKVIQQKQMTTPSGERLYVFVAGRLADGETASHASSGMAGAFVLEEHGKDVQLVAASKAMPFGSFGVAPDTVRLLQFGPDAYYGWLYESGYTGQGYTSSAASVLLPRGHAVAALANLPVHMDNEGAFPCDDEATRRRCESFDFDLQVDTARTDVKVYPLVVTRRGAQAGKAVAPTTWRIGFDEKKWRYDVPPALKAGY